MKRQRDPRFCSCGELLGEFRIELGVDVCTRCAARRKVLARVPRWRRWFSALLLPRGL